MKRYQLKLIERVGIPNTTGWATMPDMTEDPDGDWVRYEDVMEFLSNEWQSTSELDSSPAKEDNSGTRH